MTLENIHMGYVYEYPLVHPMKSYITYGKVSLLVPFYATGPLLTYLYTVVVMDIVVQCVCHHRKALACMIS